MTLPVSLDATGVGRTWGIDVDSLDGVGRGSQVVLGHMTDAGRLTRGVSSESGRTFQGASGTHRMTTGGARFHHGHLAASPCPTGFDCSPRSGVRGSSLLEQVQHVLGTLSSP